MRRTPAALTVLFLAVAPLTACSAAPSIDQRAVEAEVGEQVELQYGVVPDDVTCPSDLRGDVDTTMTCFVGFDGVELDAEVQITQVLEDKLDFRITLPDELDDGVGTS